MGPSSCVALAGSQRLERYRLTRRGHECGRAIAEASRKASPACVLFALGGGSLTVPARLGPALGERGDRPLSHVADDAMSLLAVPRGAAETISWIVPAFPKIAFEVAATGVGGKARALDGSRRTTNDQTDEAPPRK